jgi:hypothetical protein
MELNWTLTKNYNGKSLKQYFGGKKISGDKKYYFELLKQNF